MIIGTVSISSNQNNNYSNSNSNEAASSKLSTPVKTNTSQVSTVSHLVAAKSNYQEYFCAETEINTRANKRPYNGHRHKKNNFYSDENNKNSFDQQSENSQTISEQSKMNTISNTRKQNHMINDPSNRYSSTSNNYANPNQQRSRHSRQDQTVSNEESNYSNLNSKNQKTEKIYAKMKTCENVNSGEGKDYTQEEQYQNLKQQQQIQVQILPQDDNWGENMTEFTADCSDFNDDMTEDGRSCHFNDRKESGLFNNKDQNQMNEHGYNRGICRFLNSYCARYFSFICAICVSFCSFLTPILFIILPRLNINQQWQVNECGLECEGLLIGIAFKLFILLMGAWAIFARKPKASLPRVLELRALLIFLICIMTFSYWLFYCVRIIDAHTQDYFKILQFAASYVDVFIFIFVISVFILEMRQLQPQYVVKIVRSPDGEQSEYTIGNMSIQRAAVWLLEQYYKDFAVYNQWLENAHRKRGAQLLKLEQASVNESSKKIRNNKKSGSIKNFNPNEAETKSNIDHNELGEEKLTRNQTSKRMLNSSRMTTTASIVGGNFSANDRFYEEYEYERRLRKRRARLLTTTELAFNHVKRFQNDNNGSNLDGEANNGLSPTVMDPFEAAQTIFTSIARDLRRYLRVTRQQPYFTRESIVAHLANCISYDMSPRSFLQRYLNAEPLIFNERALVNASAQQNEKLSLVLPNSVGSHGVNYHLNLKTIDQSWILICDTALYQGIEDNLMFVLKQNEVSLMCSFKRLPRFNLIEDILDPKRNKFVLKLNSETTV